MWAWAATVLPITALAGISFVWVFGTDTYFAMAIIAGETLMFGVAVVWWWWALYTIRSLLNVWDHTRENVHHVLTDVKEVKKMVEETFSPNRDK